MKMNRQEWNNGYAAARLDESTNNVRRRYFASYRTNEFIKGYNYFWDNES